jgi:hypothetical protein
MNTIHNGPHNMFAKVNEPKFNQVSGFIWQCVGNRNIDLGATF